MLILNILLLDVSIINGHKRSLTANTTGTSFQEIAIRITNEIPCGYAQQIKAALDIFCTISREPVTSITAWLQNIDWQSVFAVSNQLILHDQQSQLNVTSEDLDELMRSFSG